MVSLVWSAWATYASPATAYFSTFARAWELGIGAACALLPRGLRLPEPCGSSWRTAAWARSASRSLVLSETTPFPGTAALLPVLGTAALIVAGLGEQQANLVGRTLP